MLKRSIKITFRINEKEREHLVSRAKKSGFSQEAYIRSLLAGYIPKEIPPPDYFAMRRELHAIGNNLNQIAAKAHATGHLDREVFQQEADHLRHAVLQIIKAMSEPERRNE